MTEPKWLQIDPPEDVGHVDYRATVVAVDRDAGRIRVELRAARPASDLEQWLRAEAEFPYSEGPSPERLLEAADAHAAQERALFLAAERVKLDAARIADLERELAEYKRTPACTPEVRWHARHRGKLDGPDAQALEGALSQCERELAEANAAADTADKWHTRYYAEVKRAEAAEASLAAVADWKDLWTEVLNENEHYQMNSELEQALAAPAQESKSP